MLMTFFNHLYPELYQNFIAQINVVPNHRYGETDFQGNACRKILRSHGIARNMLPQRPRGRSVHSDPRSVPFRDLLCHSLWDTIAALSKAVSSCMGGILAPNSNTMIKNYFVSFDAFVELYNRREPVISGRITSRYTMKMECLRVEVPRRLEFTKRSLLCDSEQGGEGVHSLENRLADNFKIPHSVSSGPALNIKRQRLTHTQQSSQRCLHGRSSGVSNPSDGTRSGQSALRRSRAEIKVNNPSPTATARIHATQNLPAVRRKRLQEVLAWNRLCLPMSCGLTDRLDTITRWQCNCNPPARYILDDRSRGGADLRVCGCAPYNPGPVSAVM